MKDLSPIVLFAYNRPKHLRETVDALQKNLYAKESDLYIYSDGYKNSLDKPKVNIVREYIKTIKGFKKVTIIERENNIGLAKNIISGVTEIVNKFGKVIVLEDDIVTSRYFLKYMNEALSFYKTKNKVMHISGYIYPIGAKLPETFFYNETTCWGWATWARAWKNFNPDAKYLYSKIERDKSFDKFNIDGTVDYTKHLSDNISGKMNTWAIKWYASVFLKQGLCLHPGISLVQNIGNDDSGVNSVKTSMYDHNMIDKPINILQITLEESDMVRKAVSNFCISTNRLSFLLKYKYRSSLLHNLF